MKQVGFFIVGTEDAKFGEKKIGYHYSLSEDLGYWTNRGYSLIPCFVEDSDFEYWGEDSE